jgi:hypothetical protein
MLRFALTFALGIAAVTLAGSTFNANAQEKKEKDEEKKLTGTITCAKCDLGQEKTCMTVIKVDKTVYYFDKDSSKKHHKEVCTTPKEGTVTGTVAKDGEKNTVTVKTLEFKK